MVAAAGRNNFEFWKHKLKAQKGRRPLNTGRLNKTPKTPKTAKTSIGGGVSAGCGPAGFYAYSASFSYKKKNPNASPTWKIQFGLSLFGPSGET